MNKPKEIKLIHKEYLSSHGSFHIECSLGIFNDEEIEILEKYGHWFQALHEEILLPFTSKQERFIRVANGEEHPFSIEEWAWLKYINRLKIEARYGERLNAIYVPEDDTFYSRDMAKQCLK
jgi:uncharacterized protein YifE (UPF0438 family)